MMTFAQSWCHYTSGQDESTSLSAHTQEYMNLVIANWDDEDAIYPLKTREITEAQTHNLTLNTMTNKHGYTTQLVDNTKYSAKMSRW
jgi:hypothetical protein